MTIENIIIKDLSKRFASSSGFSIKDLIGSILDLDINVYVVGGATRDWLQNIPANDIDLVVDDDITYVYEHCKKIFNESNLSFFNNIGLLKIKGELADVDINIMRNEADTKKIWEESNYSPIKEIEMDYLNRDFSINCFYYNCRTKTFHNPVEGARKDLSKRLLRIVTGPTKMKYDQRICLRILKFMSQGYFASKETLKVLEKRFEDDILTFDGFAKWLSITVTPGDGNYKSFKHLALKQNVSKLALMKLEAMFEEIEQSS
ncbi:MAG: hypothetical protein KKH44_00490 [Bacteroidetes bacterium]|nr:hypothetical protein [Bacteroidota bacterium]